MADENSERIFIDTEKQARADAGLGHRLIRDRVVELRRVRAGDLVPHPGNFRIHTGAQRATLQAGLEELGHADALITMKLPDGRLMLINGHMRADMDPDTSVPLSAFRCWVLNRRW